MLKHRRRLIPVAVAVALLALSGCAESTSVAARVDGKAITTDDVALMTQALCSERDAARNQAGQASFTTAAVSQVQGQALQVLVETRLNHLFAVREGVPNDNAVVAKQLQSLQPLLDRLPEQDRARTRELIADLFRGQAQLQQIGAAYLQSKGQRVDPQSALAAGQKQRKAFDKHVDVTFNPRYNSPGVGHTSNAQSLSRPVSDFAKNATAAKPDSQWIVRLPANQRCG